MATQWKAVSSIPGYEDCEGYEVSSEGDVLSRKRGAARVLRAPVNSQGAPHVILWREGLGRRDAYVRVLVGLAFVGPAPGDNHVLVNVNGDKEDNRASNLQWVPKGQDGSGPSSERCPLAKMTNEAVAQLRADDDGTWPYVERSAEEVGVHVQTMWKALSGRTWKKAPHPPSR